MKDDGVWLDCRGRAPVLPCIEVSRFETAYDAVSAVEKEDFHGLTDSALSLLRISRLSLPIEGSRHREV